MNSAAAHGRIGPMDGTKKTRPNGRVSEKTREFGPGRESAAPSGEQQAQIGAVGDAITVDVTASAAPSAQEDAEVGAVHHATVIQVGRVGRRWGVIGPVPATLIEVTVLEAVTGLNSPRVAATACGG